MCVVVYARTRTPASLPPPRLVSGGICGGVGGAISQSAAESLHVWFFFLVSFPSA